MAGSRRATGGRRGTGGARAGSPAAPPEGPGARRITRRLFLNGGLKATLAASLVSRLSLGALLGGQAGGVKPAPAARRYDGELIEESYDIAHRLRDGTLVIPSSLVPEGPLHDAIVLGGGVSGLMAAWELERGGLHLLGRSIPSSTRDVVAVFCEAAALERGPFDEVARLRRGEKPAQDLKMIFARYYEQLTRAAGMVDRLKT